MFVIVHIGDVHLAQTVGSVVALHFRKHSDLQAPVAGDAQIVDHVGTEREFTGQGIAVTVQVIQKIVGAAHLFQGPDQWCHQQAADPTVHFAIGHPGVIAFAEHIVEARVRHRVYQPRHQVPGIGQDVAIVQRNRFTHPRRQHIAEAVPDISSLAHFRRCQILLTKLEINGPQSRPVVPQHFEVLGQLREILEGMAILLLVRPVQADNNLIQIGHLAKFLHDVFQGRAFQLGIERRQHQGHGAGFAEVHQLRFEVLHRAANQVMEGGDNAILVKVAHGGSPSLFPYSNRSVPVLK